MNKTFKTIAIVFLVLGALAVITGVVVGMAGRHMLGRGVPFNYQPKMTQPKGDLNTRDGFQPLGRRGFMGFPLWLIGSGLTFLIAGSVLFIFNKKMTAAVEPSPSVTKEIKKDAPVKAKKAPATTKTTRKKAT